MSAFHSGLSPSPTYNFADDVALPTEMLSVCILAMEIMQEEAAAFGMEISWLKTKIQTVSTHNHFSVLHDPKSLQSPTERYLEFEHPNEDEVTPSECIRSSSPVSWTRNMITHLCA